MISLKSKKSSNGDKFMSELHLKQPGFTYSACEPFINIVKEFKNLEKYVTY